METVDPKSLPRLLHVIPRRGMWRVSWSDGQKAIRLLSGKKQAISYAKNKSGGLYSVIVHEPSGFADVESSILIEKSKSAFKTR